MTNLRKVAFLVEMSEFHSKSRSNYGETYKLGKLKVFNQSCSLA